MFEFLPVYAKIYIFVLTFLVGAVFGSALNCLAYRIAHEQKWSKGRSVCVSCGHTLSLPDLVPVFSYLFLKGKCRHCKEKISPRYVLTECFLGLCFVLLLARYGFSLEIISPLIFVCCLFALSLVDMDIQIIPDRFLIIPAVVQIIWLIIFGGILRGILTALIFGGALLLISLFMDKILKKESMGGGDIKLLALFGLFFPASQLLLLLVMACIIGLIIAAVIMKIKDSTPFPFGPALSLAAFITLLVGEKVVSWYLGLF